MILTKGNIGKKRENIYPIIHNAGVGSSSLPVATIFSFAYMLCRIPGGGCLVQVISHLEVHPEFCRCPQSVSKV